MKINVTSHVLPREPGQGADACLWKMEEQTVIAALADGAGAARCGAEAAKRIVENFVTNYSARPMDWSPKRALHEFARILNEALYRESLARFEAPELISTLSVAVLEGDRLYGLNVGDSRIYLSRAGSVQQLSEDHVDAEMCHVLRRAIGLSPTVEPHYFETEIHDGDLAVLCSDGVSNVISAEQLAEQFRSRVSARALVQEAREKATEEQLDDLSAVVIDVTTTGRLRSERSTCLPIPAHLKRGTVVDGFELIRSFAGTDRVWVATKDDRRWTLKFAPVEAERDEDLLARFVKEAWNAARAAAIAPELFVTVHTPEKPSARYYVQEFVEAPSLKTTLKARRLSSDEAVRLGKFLTKAGERLLHLDLVHGDLKPENVLVLAEYDHLRFKLIDLGSAAELFTTTSRAGTASYLAPERFHGAPASERTEIFAIGVTLYESLTGRLPFGEIERFQTPIFHTLRKPSALNPNVPAWLDHVLIRALSVDPVRRYQHYSALSFDLAHPDQVEPFFGPGTPLLERNPLGFYRTGFWVLVALCIYLFFRLLTAN